MLPGGDPGLRRALRSGRKTTRLLVWRMRHSGVRLSSFLPARYGIDPARLGGAGGRARLRACAHVRTTSRLPIRALRYPCSLQWRFARISTGIRYRGRTLTLHRDRAASIWTSRACRLHRVDGPGYHCRGVDRLGDYAPGHHMKRTKPVTVTFLGSGDTFGSGGRYGPHHSSSKQNRPINSAPVSHAHGALRGALCIRAVRVAYGPLRVRFR